MPTGQYSSSVSAGGTIITGLQSVTTDGVDPREVTLPVGKAGTLTARTDANTGEATLGSGHGITDGMIVDVRWAAGVRYGMTVGTVASLVVPIDGGTGDDLPTHSPPTALVLTQQVQVNVPIDGDNAALVSLKAEYLSSTSTAKAHLDFQESDNTSVRALSLDANIPETLLSTAAVAAYGGDPITKCMATNGSSSEVCTLKIIVMQDTTP